MNWLERVLGRHVAGGASEGASDLFRSRVREADARLGARHKEARAELDSYLETLDVSSASLVYPHVLNLTEARRLLRELTEIVDADAPPLYVASTLLLQDAYTYLTRDHAEDMTYVTGSEWADGRVLERMITFEKAHRSPVRVEGNPDSSHQALIGLSLNGHRLLAWLHSHPGHGETATLPSGIDIGHQERLERGAYPAIGAIFSRDGYVRFFSKDIRFQIHVHGKGVRKINGRLYQLEVG